MDTDLLKTFLEVNRTRHFGKAAEHLFLTQSAVSARIRQLEDILGTQLFVRLRNDIRLTPAGSKLVKHAESILNTWHRARQEAALGGEDKELLALGAVYSLWDILLQNWMSDFYRRHANLAVQAEAHSAEILVRRLLDGTLDLGMMFEPPQLAELLVREISTIRLIMVSTREGLAVAEALGSGYVMVDWGTSFAIAHARHFPDMAPPAVRMGMGRLALGFLESCGGSAYLAAPTVERQLREGVLYPVVDAPVIDRKVYAVHAQHSERQALVDEVLRELETWGRGTTVPPGRRASGA